MFPVTPTERSYQTMEYWSDVIHGRQEPDEFQRALIDVTQQALDAGMFYTVDVDKYVREHAEFIPAEAWTWQYSTPVEGGIMGFHVYQANKSIEEAIRRAERIAATAKYLAGTRLGTLYINGKRYTGMTITSYEDGRCIMTGKAGKYIVTVKAEPAGIDTMIERAERRGWRKPATS